MIPKKMQKGGILLKKSPEEAINFFIDNSLEVRILYGTENSSSGVIFTCTLRDGIESPYEMIRSNDFKSPVKELIIKLVGIASEVHNEAADDYEPLKWGGIVSNLPEKKIEQEEAFIREINIQTDVFLKTIEYLDPLCPAPVYASIKKVKADAIAFVTKMRSKATISKTTTRILDDVITNLNSSQIPFLGILGMEVANGYDVLYESYHNGTSQTNVRLYENMARLKNIELALKTGYSQNDFHSGNILVNPTAPGYYKDIPGNVLLIDFGYADKIPSEKLKQIKQYVADNNYVRALKIFGTFNRPDMVPLDAWPDFYGWMSYSYNNITQTPLVLQDSQFPAINTQLVELNHAHDSAIDDRIAVFNSDSHRDERGNYPLLPLSNAIKNSLFEGLLHGGKKKKKLKTKRNKKNSKNKNLTRRKRIRRNRITR